MERAIDLSIVFPGVLDPTLMQSKEYQLAKDIMSQEVITITSEAMMDEAARIMGNKHIGSLIVVRDGVPVGIVTERDLLSDIMARGKDPKEIVVRSVMSAPLIKINPTASIKQVAKTMIAKKGRLAVFEGEKLVGIITASDLIRSLPQASETILKVRDYMTKNVVTADENVTVTRVTKIMGEKRIGSVIITRKGEPRGIFTERDLLTTFLAKNRPLSIKVAGVASSPLLVAPSWISVHHAAFMMSRKHIKRLPITEDNKIVGIITARDLVEAYAK
jgi:CBS domain-containing protein